MRLLLAATETDLRLALELLLSEQPGVKIVGTVTDSAGLLALIQTAKPDVVCVDWHLSGRPLPFILSHAAQQPNPPQFIILTTTNTESQAAAEAGANFTVVKGAPPETLLKAFQEATEQTLHRR